MNHKVKPSIITIGGMIGSGKTTLADNLAKALTESGREAVSIDSDRIRKELYGIPETSPLPQEAYSREFTQMLIAETQRRVESLLDQGITVVQSAACASKPSRKRQEAYAEKLGVDFQGVYLTCDEAELRKRVIERKERKDSPSDAGIDILEKFLKSQDLDMSWPKVNSNQPKADVLADALSALNIAGQTPSVDARSDKKPTPPKQNGPRR